jgi:two-component system chemotaxis response regulator CheB
MHLSPRMPSRLAELLAKAGPLPAVTAVDGMAIQTGRIHVAPSDRHMLIERDRLRVVRGPSENRQRPAIDPLFRSAAWAYGPQVVGVVLTGNLDDGSAGLWAVKSCGGITVVQEPAEAEHPEMPMNALLRSKVDHRLPLAQIADLLGTLARRPASEYPPDAPRETLQLEIEAAKLNGDASTADRLGLLSPFTCPACRGALWEMEEDGQLRYRCHVGHAYSPDSLMLDQSGTVEQSLFVALRAVEEKAMMLRRMSERWSPDRSHGLKESYEDRARELDVAADTLKSILAGDKR